MQGHPAASGAPAAPAAPPEIGAVPNEPTFETVRVGDLELEVDAATKAALEVELARLQQPPAAPTPAPAPPQPSAEPSSPISQIKDLNTRIFTEPETVLQELYQIASNDISQSLRNEYRAVQDERDFWSKFYKDNDDLAGNELLVRAVVERDRSQIGNLGAWDKIAKHVADATRSEMLRIRGASAAPSPPPRAVMSASSAGPRASAPVATEPSNVTSVTQILRKRHAKRMGGGE